MRNRVHACLWSCAVRTLGLACLPLVMPAGWSAGDSTPGEELPGGSPAWNRPAAGAQAFTPEGAEPDALDASFDLAAAIEAAAARNPRLSAARSRWLAARERPAQKRSLPDPILTYTEMVQPIETRVGPLERSWSLTQKIPYPSKLSLAGSIADQHARIGELEYHIALRDVVADVKVSYAELLYLRKAIRIVEQNQAIAQQLAEKATALYAQSPDGRPDAVSLFDTQKAQSQLAQLAYDKVTLQELARSEESRMNGLLSRAPGALFGTLADLAHRPLRATREELQQLAMERRQELQSATSRIGAADDALRLAQLSQVPDFSVGVQHSVIGPARSAVAGGGDDAVGVMFGVTLPLWSGKNRAAMAEAEHLRRAARYERQAAVDDLLPRITQAWFKLANAGRLVELYETSLIPQAARAMEIAEKWRDTGRDTFGRLLEAQAVWLNFQLAQQRARADYEQMVARLEQLVGVSLGTFRREEAR